MSGRGNPEADTVERGNLGNRSEPNNLSALEARPVISAEKVKGRGRGKERTKDRSGVSCRFWPRCKAGDDCPYFHDPSLASDNTHRDNGPSKARPSRVENPSSGVVRKPVPQGDPREFQIQQLVRRFSPVVTDAANGTLIALQMKPSDPDFPFEMPILDCELHIPKSYPRAGEQPTIRVRNKEMDRGFQINVERGFDNIISTAPKGTLLRWMNSLDRRLEEFLTAEKAETIKIIPHRIAAKEIREQAPSSTQHKAPDYRTRTTVSSTHNTPPDSSVNSQKRDVIPNPKYTPEELSVASIRYTRETRQLEARMGRLQGFSKKDGQEGQIYRIPIEPRRRQDLPHKIQQLRFLGLRVPNRYPLMPSTIELEGVGGSDADKVTKMWADRQKDARTDADITLLGCVNQLSSNIHLWARENVSEIPTVVTTSRDEPTHTSKEETHIVTGKKPVAQNNEEDKPHIQYIPRPPEWDVQDNQNSDSETDFSASSSEYDLESHSSSEELSLSSHAEDFTSESPPQHGIALSFPSLILHNIELLTLNSVSITLKCLRCKHALELSSLTTTSKTTACPQCSTSITASFRPTLMHPSSSRAGYFDIEGATPIDLLLSPFTPTCASCSTPFASGNIMGVRGAEPRAICRSCHQHMSFSMPDIKFLALSSYAARHANAGAPKRKQPKERLGLVAGEPLPKNGRCKHYSKSYRWFRFSCCGKVYACDRCHDDGEGHPNERAERMICGYCSREQRFRPEECGICHRDVVRKKGGGFWEGGKGTRDKARMSRKDPRKYKRIGGGSGGAGESKGKGKGKGKE